MGDEKYRAFAVAPPCEYWQWRTVCKTEVIKDGFAESPFAGFDHPIELAKIQ
jgi:hypothetical protein